MYLSRLDFGIRLSGFGIRTSIRRNIAYEGGVCQAIKYPSRVSLDSKGGGGSGGEFAVSQNVINKTLSFDISSTVMPNQILNSATQT